jgi:hypothetical protein
MLEKWKWHDTPISHPLVSGKNIFNLLQTNNGNTFTNMSPRWGFVLFFLIFYHIVAATLLL